jgi:hypothetical protein
MEKVAGFPRPLYPPDAAAHGKQPSAPGPDVEAYKRTVSRAGRWPWSDFNDTYTDEFALGRAGGNVPETGIAGVQRQGHLDDTGWVGEKTFNLLRSIVIPSPLPNHGQPAMDQTSINLINQAYELFGGHEPAPDSPQRATREAALDLAAGQLGVKESPPESNQVKYTDWYGMIGPWCAMFVTWAYELNDAGPSPSFVRGTNYAYVPYMVSDAQSGYNGFSVTDDPIPGDLVCFDWDWNWEYDHVGLFEKWTGPTTFSAIEGNTSTSNQSNGGEVMRRTRDVNGQRTVFIRVREP